jgi:microcystin-dependent protein
MHLMRTPSFILSLCVASMAMFVAGAARAQDATQPYIGQIMLVSFGFAPKGWAECNGQILPINQNQALFALLGTTYGGDGRVTFALPDLRGRVPVHAVTTVQLGERGGEETHTLTVSELPLHTHAALADSGVGSTTSPAGNFPARDAGSSTMYGPVPTGQGVALSAAGGSQPHENRMPYLGLRYIIALQGVFPARN